MAIFDDLIKRASQFVEKQKGVWDHSKWQGFLSDIQQKGLKMTEEMQNYLGSVLESMKKFYESTTDTEKKMTGTVSDEAAKLVEKTRGKWEHLDWEKFVKDTQQRGIDLTEETKANLGGILESAKKFYFSLPLTKKEKKEKEKAPKKPAKPPKKVTKAKAPEKEKKPPQKKPAEKVEIKKAEETKATRTVKAAPPKKKEAKESTVKKPAKGTAKTKASLMSKKK